MYSIAFLLFLGTALTANSERHSLTYIYTALSKPVGLPGIHEFTAMGLLDNRMIDYFDSDAQEKVPKQNWMKERMKPDYWKKGTQSRKKKQDWFRRNIDILMDRKKQNDSASDLHVLQWMHGCEGDKQGNGTLTFVSAKNAYSFDGQSFLYFDDTSKVWVASADMAHPTKSSWDQHPFLKEHTRGYLEKNCIEWLSKFINYEIKQLETASPPEIYLFTRNSKFKTKVILSCLATGLHSRDIELIIKRDGRVLTDKDGVNSSGVRPNGDDTYQRRDHVEILRSDQSGFTCEVKHSASGVDVKKEWDRTLPDPEPVAAIVGGLVGILLLVVIAGVLLFLVKKGVIGSPPLYEQTHQLDVIVPATASAVNEGSRGSVGSSDSGISSRENGNSSPESDSLMGNDGAQQV